MTIRYKRHIILVLLLTASTTFAADDWPQFRGPGGDGQATGTLPTEWSEAEHVAWKTKIPGRGYSSPVIADGRVWLTSAVESPVPDGLSKADAPDMGNGEKQVTDLQVELLAIAIDVRSGEIIQKVSLTTIIGPVSVHGTNSYASPTPVLSAGRVYCHFGSYGTFCIDANSGKILWRAKLLIQHGVGPGSSPIVYENRLILVCDGMDQQYVAALDTASGKQLWKTNRPPIRTPNGDFKKSFCTPLLITHKAQDQLIIPGAQWFISYEPLTGKEIWRFDHGAGFSIVPRPVYSDGIVFFSTGFLRPTLIAIKVDSAAGDVTKSHEVWRQTKRISTRPSYVISGNELYIVSDGGVATCFDTKTGKINWVERLGGDITASPIHADGKIFFCNHRGETNIIKAATAYELIATNTLDGEFMASPAVVGTSLILRSKKALYRIDE
jgi:outer membrane protein assembly factor BamB